MNGAYNITDVARTVRPPSTHHDSLSSSEASQTERPTVDPAGDGALAAADQALNQVLGSSGFVDIAAPFSQSFAACLDYQSVPAGSEDLDAGALRGLIAYVKSKIAANPAQSEQAHTRIPPQAAVRLLA